MAKRQHKIKIFLSIVKIPCFCQKNSKNPEKLIVFQGFYSGQHFYPLNMARQEQPRLNQTENALKYVFLNGVASVVAQRQYKPRSYANNYNVHGANGKFVRI